MNFFFDLLKVNHLFKIFAGFEFIGLIAKKVLVINEIKIPVNVIQIAEDTKKENSLFKKYEMTTTHYCT